MRTLLGALALTLITTSAHAFCGFYVKEDDTRITSRASRVVLMRDGTTTVLSMQNTYEGPTEDFALIVPVPTAIGPDDVRVLEPEVFERVDELSAPRLVEYQQQPFHCPRNGVGGLSLHGTGRGGGGGSAVQVEAEFAVGEYDVQVLGASESTGLEAWLRDQGYRIPDGASRALRPYVQQGFRFFAARVAADRVRFEGGRALLSPLRIHYTSEHLTLPIRLGRLSADGEQDLIVYVLSRDGRYEVANRENVFVPTNLEVSARIRGRFGAFYDELLGRVWEHHPDAAITEYAWDATRCDPCPGPVLDASDITTLGGDHASGAIDQPSNGIGYRRGPHAWLGGPRLAQETVDEVVNARWAAVVECVRDPIELHADVEIRDGIVERAQVEAGADRAETARCIQAALVSQAAPTTVRPAASRYRLSLAIHRTVRRVQPNPRGFTLTRIRYRTRPGSPLSDLVFRRAVPIEGGIGTPDREGLFRTAPHRGELNRFQARFAILHRARAPRCESPWGGDWGAPPRPTAAPALESLERTGHVPIQRLLRTSVPALDLRPRPPRRAQTRRRQRASSLSSLLGLLAFGGVLALRPRRRR